MKLDLGAGTVNNREGYLRVDANPAVRPDIVALVPPIPAPDGSCEALFASHFLEHLTKDVVSELMKEAYRVLMPGGEFEIAVPYAFSHGAHQDPTHVSYWVPESFYYYTKESTYLCYGIENRFELVGSAVLGSEVRAVLRKPL